MFAHASPFDAMPFGRHAEPLRRHAPHLRAAEPVIERREREGAIDVLVTAPPHFKLTHVSPSSEPGSSDLTLDGHLVSIEPSEYIARRRVALYSRKSPSFLHGYLPAGSRLAGNAVGGHWIELEDGSFAVNDRSLALTHEQAAPVRFSKRVHLPSNAVVAQATGHDLERGGLAVTVPLRMPAAKGRHVVVHGPRVAVRRVPSLSGAIVGTRNQGEVVDGEETSGWLRLSDGSGWMLIDGRSLGLGRLLAPISHSTPKASEAAARPSGGGAKTAPHPPKPEPPKPAASAPAGAQSAPQQARKAKSKSSANGEGQSMHSALPKQDPVLVECAPSAANIAKPPQYSVEEWEATEDGGFVRVDMVEWLAEWDTLLDDLAEMGFDDCESNRAALVKHSGSIKRAVKELVASRRARRAGM